MRRRNRIIAARVTEEEFALIRAVADERQLSLSEQAREAMMSYLFRLGGATVTREPKTATGA